MNKKIIFFVLVSAALIGILSNRYFNKTTKGWDVFCKIISGEQKGKILAKGKNTTIIESLRGNPLAVPNKHISSLKKINLSDLLDLADMFLFAAKISSNLSKFKDKPYNYAYFHTGVRAAQTVPHIHMHMSSRNNIPSQTNINNQTVYDENNYAKVVQGSNNNQILIIPKNEVGHLNSTQLNASEVAHALILGSKILKQYFPDKDYVTRIYNTFDKLNKATVKIIVDLH